MKAKSILTMLLATLLVFGNVYAQSEDDIREETELSAEQSDGNDQVTFRHGERRLERPFQIQIVQTFGPATPHSFAPGGGLHLGYQLSQSLYLGLTSSAYADGRNILDDYHNYNYDDDDDRKYNDGEVYGQEGADITESELDPVHLLELRVTPWNFGLYFSFGAMYRGKQTSTTEFKNETRTIGDNDYTTGLTATLEYKEWYSAATGVGFNHIFQGGLTLGTAMIWGLNSQTPDVTVSSTAAVSAEDLSYWKKQIQHNERQLPYLFTFSLGYAF